MFATRSAAVRVFAKSPRLPATGLMRRHVVSGHWVDVFTMSLCPGPRGAARRFGTGSNGGADAACTKAALARAVIARYDSDGDGRLDEAELAQVIAELSPGGASYTPQDWVEENIAPKLAPLISFVQTPRTWDPPPDPSKLMKTIDKDKDGYVTEDELLQWWNTFKPFDPSTQTAPLLIHRWAGTVVDSIVLCVPLWLIHMVTGGMLGPLYNLVVGLAYTFRDCLFNNGTRSLGKKLLSLEIVQIEKAEDGTNMPTDKVATLQHCIMRNGYMMPFFVWDLIPFDLGPVDLAIGVTAVVVSFVNTYFVLFVSCKRTVGDRLAGTMVVYESPNYAQRSLARALIAAKPPAESTTKSK
jgi:uncharacterized RDD family membrane protein YckC